MGRNRKIAIAIVSGSLLAAGSGYFTSVQIAQGQTSGATRTVTIDVGTGEQGPAGPAGPAGPEGPAGPGGDPCSGAPTGYAPGVLVFNHPGGQVSIFTCLGPE